ncbi:MAG: hypothetical protein H6823_19785 [Planctomycetaceae bacterium]|nr:hypothetical protein [Planctomycetaceae bacterium]
MISSANTNAAVKNDDQEVDELRNESAFRAAATSSIGASARPAIGGSFLPANPYYQPDFRIKVIDFSLERNQSHRLRAKVRQLFCLF